ncbi:MAG: hypothetical protein PHP25_05460, partial [Candidatus Moranbacteria bacterium]|nr:hypothetical protein [Candidatus Moranbacteria bacterium]
IPLDEIDSFLDLVGKIDTHTTLNKVLDAGKPDSLMAVSHVFLRNVRAFILIPRTGKYDEIQELAKDIFNLDLVERKKKEISSEEATVAFVNASGKAGFDKKLDALLEKIGYETEAAFPAAIKSLQPASRAQTLLIDRTNGLKPFSLEDLSKKFSAEISPNSSADFSARCQKADFCLVAGSDLTENIGYEENSLLDLEQGYDKQTVDERQYIELLKKGSSQKF